MSTVLSTLIMILLVSFLILIHEAGHFFMAKFFKMRVTRFGFGLPVGPTLWSKKFGETEFVIHAFLFGGYVAFPDDDKELNLPADSPDRFLNRPIYQRFFVLSAGVMANLICAFFLVILTACIWGQMPSGKYEVFVKNIVAPQQESVWQSGMQPGDKVLEVNGSKITNPNAFVMYAQLSKKFDGKISEISLETNYEKIKALNPAFARDELIPENAIITLPEYKDENPFRLNDDVLIGFEVMKDSRIELNNAQKSLRDKVYKKDSVISNGTYTLNDIAYAYTDNVPPLNIVVERNGQRIELNPIYPNEQGTIGIMMDIREIPIKTKGFVSIVKTSTKYLWDQTRIFVYSWKQLFTGKLPVSSLHGIIAITKVGGDIIQTSGMSSGLLLTAIISLYLAIFNFLPIPALDGGHVFFLIIEKIRGKRVDDVTADKIMAVFFLILVVLIVLICANDIYALIMKKL